MAAPFSMNALSDICFTAYSPFLALSFAVAVLLAGWRIHQRRKNLHLPPSPPSDPIIGHYRIFPRTYQAEHFFEWSKKYGEQ